MRMLFFRYRQLLHLSIFLLLCLFSLLLLDFSSLQQFSWQQGKTIFLGLLQPAWGFIYDGSGEDLVSLLGGTIAIACLGTMIATLFAFPLAVLSAKNVGLLPRKVSFLGKLGIELLRAFPELVFAIIFVRVVGPGPFAGALAIGIHQIGMLGKLFAEELEAMPQREIEDYQAVGANIWQIIFFVRLPKALPLFCSFILNHFEIAVRSAATLGLVGAGGLGAPLIFAVQTRNWSKVSVLLLGIMVTVFLLDQLTGKLRRKLTQ